MKFNSASVIVHNSVFIMEKIGAELATTVSLNRSKNRDEHHTLFTKLLSDSVVSDRTDCVGIVKKPDQCFCSMTDFTGGAIHNDQKLDVQSNLHRSDKITDSNRSITATPADSSCGFHNTLSVLECHLNKNKYPKLSQQQIKDILSENKDVAIHNNNSIDIPIIDQSSISTRENIKSDSHMNDEKFSIEFEPELELMGRYVSMWDKSNPSYNFESSSLPADLPLLPKRTEENASIENEYIYHVARSRSGQLYLRVRRDLRCDQGTLNHINSFILSVKIDRAKYSTAILANFNIALEIYREYTQ